MFVNLILMRQAKSFKASKIFQGKQDLSRQASPNKAGKIRRGRQNLSGQAGNRAGKN
jgi:hypothetical protein